MRILMIDDPKDIADPVLDEVEKEYVVDVARSGVEGNYLSEVNDYDAIIVKSTVSDLNAYDVCRIARAANVPSPIIYVSDSPCVKDKVCALNAGADAYLSQPLDYEELHASIKALIRRTSGQGDMSLLKAKRIVMDVNTGKVYYKGRLVYLRRREFDLLEFFLLNKGRVLSVEQILEHVWKGGLDVLSNTVEVHIKSLRAKLDKKVIKTKKGFGYILEG